MLCIENNAHMSNNLTLCNLNSKRIFKKIYNILLHIFDAF